MNTENTPFAFQSTVTYSLSGALGILAIIYGQYVFKAVSIAQPALF